MSLEKINQLALNLPPELHAEYILASSELADSAFKEGHFEGYKLGYEDGEVSMPRLSELEDICIRAGLPEPSVRKKLWATVIEIPGFYNRCYPETRVSIQMAIQWCQGYIGENNVK